MSTKSQEQDIFQYLTIRCGLREARIDSNASLSDDLGLDEEDSVEFAQWFRDHFKHPLPPVVVSAISDGPPPVGAWILAELILPSWGLRQSRATFLRMRKMITVNWLARFAEAPKDVGLRPNRKRKVSNAWVRAGMQVVILWMFFVILAQFQTRWVELHESASVALVVTGVVWLMIQPIGIGYARRWQNRFNRAMNKSLQAMERSG